MKRKIRIGTLLTLQHYSCYFVYSLPTVRITVHVPAVARKTPVRPTMLTLGTRCLQTRQIISLQLVTVVGRQTCRIYSSNTHAEMFRKKTDVVNL